MGKMIKNYLKRIKTTNINNDINRVMDFFFERLKSKKEIRGIIKLGGLAARNFSDIHSDIDASILVDGPAQWLPQFEFYVPAPYKGIPFFEINVHQNTIEREFDREWEEAKKEAYEEGEIIFQRDRRVHELIARKVRFDHEAGEKRKRHLMTAVTRYRPSLNPVNDHLALNKMLNQLMEIVYLSNREFRPHKKWRFEKIRYAPRLPEDFESLIQEALLVKGLNTEDAARRRDALVKILDFYASAIPEPGQAAVTQPGNKNAVYSEYQQKQMLALICGQFYWYVDINPLRQVERGFIYNSHDLINEALAMVLEALRIAKNKEIRQFIEPLNVISPFPAYSEDNYDLRENFDELRELEKSFINALYVKDFSRKTVELRTADLQKVSHFLVDYYRKANWVPEDPYHFALSHVYFDRQLVKETFGERVCPSDLDEHDEKLFKGFVSYHLAGSKKELLESLKHPTKGIYSARQIQGIRKIANGLF